MRGFSCHQVNLILIKWKTECMEKWGLHQVTCERNLLQVDVLGLTAAIWHYKVFVEETIVAMLYQMGARGLKYVKSLSAWEMPYKCFHKCKLLETIIDFLRFSGVIWYFKVLVKELCWAIDGCKLLETIRFYCWKIRYSDLLILRYRSASQKIQSFRNPS